jgi:T5SS/PEP-CTERM-associated repeat protein
VAVEVSGSRWTVENTLYVGNEGSGTLAIADGGFVSSNFASVAHETGSTGEATVRGAGSQWENSSVVIGNRGGGSLEVTDGGAVLSHYCASVGGGSGSGAALVDGPGSAWTVLQDFTVGGTGRGELDITGGGHVDVGADSWIGRSGGDGSVEVAGDASRLTVGRELNVGGDYVFAATGTLDIRSGATVADANGFVGRRQGSKGTVRVNGAGSAWSHSDSLFLAGDNSRLGGTGDMFVTAGGLVMAGNAVTVRRGGALHLGGGTVAASVLELAGGELRGNGRVEAGIVNVGAIIQYAASDTLTIIGGYEQGAEGVLSAILAPGRVTGPFLTIAGDATLDGILDITMADSQVFAEGDQFDLLTATNLMGQFSDLRLPGLVDGLRWDMRYVVGDSGAGIARLEVATVPLPANFWLLALALAVPSMRLCKDRGGKYQGRRGVTLPKA